MPKEFSNDRTTPRLPEHVLISFGMGLEQYFNKKMLEAPTPPHLILLAKQADLALFEHGISIKPGISINL